jgi:hypothetical protein
MRIGGSIFLIALGAILTFAIHVQTRGFSIHTIGIILMMAGSAAAALTLIIWSERANTVIGPSPRRRVHRRTPRYRLRRLPPSVTPACPEGVTPAWIPARHLGRV